MGILKTSEENTQTRSFISDKYPQMMQEHMDIIDFKHTLSEKTMKLIEERYPKEELLKRASKENIRKLKAQKYR